MVTGCRTQSPELKELNHHFTYKGQPVNPRAVEDISEWISDDHPGPVAVDLDGTVDSNRYYGEVWQRDGMVGFDRDEPDSVFGKGFFVYRYCGRLANGCHVLKTVYNGGGSGDFESLLLVNFVTNPFFDEYGHVQERMVMEQMGEFPLGDRVNAVVEVHGNAVTWKSNDAGIQKIQF